MEKHNKLLYSVCLFFVLGVNPRACSLAMKGCRSESQAIEKATIRAAEARVAENVAIKAAEARAVENAAQGLNGAKKSNHGSNFKQLFADANQGYTYNNKKYNNFKDIPFSQNEEIFFNRALSSYEADYLMKRGVKFVYNSNAYLKQKDKSFKIIFLISDDFKTVKKLYELDDANAKKMLDFSSEILSNKSIEKVSTYEEMIAKQNEALAENKVPILVFHNSVKTQTLNRFSERSNFITCNSFSVDPKSYLTSTDLLDMRAIIEGINVSYSSENLEGFYYNFTSKYYSHMADKHKYTSLVYIGTGISVGGGVVAIAYYNSKS